MSRRMFTSLAMALLSMAATDTTAHAGRIKDRWESWRECWECCGLAKPKPTGPMNNCYGYFHTGWRAWTPECQPCPSQIPMVSTAPVKTETAPSPTTTPTPPAAVPPVTPPATDKGDKIGAANNRATVVRVVATQPAQSKPVTPSVRSSDSGWSPVPAVIQPKR